MYVDGFIRFCNLKVGDIIRVDYYKKPEFRKIIDITNNGLITHICKKGYKSYDSYFNADHMILYKKENGKLVRLAVIHI